MDNAHDRPTQPPNKKVTKATGTDTYKSQRFDIVIEREKRIRKG
jgi:hypothetical protein